MAVVMLAKRHWTNAPCSRAQLPMMRVVAWWRLAVFVGAWVVRVVSFEAASPPIPGLRVVSMPSYAIPAPLLVGQSHSFVPTPGQAASIASALAEAALECDVEEKGLGACAASSLVALVRQGSPSSIATLCSVSMRSRSRLRA